MNKSIRRIWNVISIILVVIVVALTILLVGVRLIGLQPSVLSGSMEPTYHTGALIYVKRSSLRKQRSVIPLLSYWTISSISPPTG